MGWTNDSITELVAPNTIPFVPGNNVTGFGSNLPPELVAAGYTNAIVFYSTEWNPAATVQTVKFRFIAGSSRGLNLGYGICNNPSVNQTATIVSAEVLRTPGTFFGLELDNSVGNVIFFACDDAIGAGGPGNGGLLDILDAAGFARIRQQANGAGTSTVIGLYDTLNNQRIDLSAVNTGKTTIGIHDKNNKQRIVLGDLTGGGNGILYVSDQNGAVQFSATVSTTQVVIQNFSATLTIPSSSAYVQTNVPLEWDTAWSALPLVNGWTADGIRVPLYRQMADGTVQMKGVITKAGNPVNGEQWINALPLSAAPLHTWSFLTPTPGRPYNGSQVIEIHSDGTGVIYDMAALPGVICLDNVRYTSQY